MHFVDSFALSAVQVVLGAVESFPQPPAPVLHLHPIVDRMSAATIHISSQMTP